MATALAPAAGAADNYGAIAYSGNGSWGRAWDYPTRPAAEATAVKSCAYSDCKVLTSFSACGAVAANGAGFGEILFDELEARGQLSDSLLNLELEVAKPLAAAAGRVWARLGKTEQTVGVDSLSLSFRDARWDLAEPAELYFEDSGALAVHDFELVSSSRNRCSMVSTTASLVLRTTFPVKPSHTTTSVVPR